MLRMSFYRISLATAIYSIRTTDKSLCDNDFMWQESVQQEDAHVVTERGRSEKRRRTRRYTERQLSLGW